MTPAINCVKKAKTQFKTHEYAHDSTCAAFGLETVEKLGLNANQVFKTLVVQLDNQELAVALIPVANTLSMKRIAKATGSKKATMAEPKAVQRSTGYVLGGVSPLGQKRRLTTFIDTSALNFSTIFISAGRRGLELELAPKDLANLCQAKFSELHAD